MDLTDWMTAKNQSDASMAPAVPCTRATFWRYRTGRRDVPAWVAERIQEITGGAVTVMDLHCARVAWMRDNGQWPPPEAQRQKAA